MFYSRACVSAWRTCTRAPHKHTAAAFVSIVACVRATLTHTTQLPPTIGLSFFRLHRVCPINQSRQFSQCIAFGQHFLLFFAYGMPISHIRGHSSRSRQRGTHSHSHTRLGYPTNPTTSFQGSTASQLFLATTTTTTSFSLSRCVFPPVLLTLDHWTKIDSTLLVLFSCLTFPLFYTFCVCFSTTPHTQLAFLSTPFPFVSLIRQSSSPGGYSLLQQILHLNSTTSNCCPTVHTPLITLMTTSTTTTTTGAATSDWDVDVIITHANQRWWWCDTQCVREFDVVVGRRTWGTSHTRTAHTHTQSLRYTIFHSHPAVDWFEVSSTIFGSPKKQNIATSGQEQPDPAPPEEVKRKRKIWL